MEKIKLSVIIPIYNVEKYLEACLNSIVNQTLKEIEVICVNDGSTDSSNEIINKYATKYNNIKVINHEKNFGQSIARNNGFEAATGKYIYFLDSDDYLNDLNALEILFNNCEINELDIALFDSDIIYEDNYNGYENDIKEYFKYANQCNKKYLGTNLISGTKLFNTLVEHNCYRQNVCFRIYKREFLKNINLKFYENIIYEDILYSIIADIKAKRVKYINKSFYVYIKRNNSTMSRKNLKKSIEGHYVSANELFKFLNEYPEIKNDEITKKSLKHLIKQYYKYSISDCDIIKDIDMRKNIISNIDKELIDISMDILINQPNIYYFK